MVTKNAHRQATAADSVAVKMPDKIPPRIITTVNSPHSASKKIFTACLNGIFSPFG
ncbi:hypothetical protein D3C71_2127070 [compost metagenome]